MSNHVEIHVLSSASDAARLGDAGFPRLDLEPNRCDACNGRVGMVEGSTPEAKFWIACGLVVSERNIATVCWRCLSPVDKALKGIYH